MENLEKMFEEIKPYLPYMFAAIGALVLVSMLRGKGEDKHIRIQL
ncbi:MAG: hypothetical protein QXQ24_05460 [Nitrososphaeria archaeon]